MSLCENTTWECPANRKRKCEIEEVCCLYHLLCNTHYWIHVATYHLMYFTDFHFVSSLYLTVPVLLVSGRVKAVLRQIWAKL